MPQLHSVRVCCVGHPRARFEDLTIPFADLNEENVHSIVSLRNGGGKTALIGLLFHVICPEKKMPDGRTIEDYVREQDCSVIALEWTLDTVANQKQERYITGVFCEWRQSHLQEQRTLRRLFFCGRVLDTDVRLTLDGLPLYTFVDGNKHRRTLSSFRREWESLRSGYAHAEVAAYEHQGEWRKTLEHVGIDPVLFGYQIRMNWHEAGVGADFKFKSANDFIDFFLELTMDPLLGKKTNGLIETLHKTIQSHASQLRPELTALRSLIPQFQALEQLKSKRVNLYQTIRQLDSQTRVLGQQIDRVLEQKYGEEQVLQQESQEAQEQSRTLKELMKQEQALTSFWLYQAALRRLPVIQNTQKDAQVRITDALFQETCWYAAEPVFRWQSATKAVVSLQAQIRQQQQEEVPLLEAATQSAHRYMAALLYQKSLLQQAYAASLEEERRCRDTAQIGRQRAQREEIQAEAQQKRAISLEEQRYERLRIRAQLETKQSVRPQESYRQAYGRWHKEETEVLQQEQALQIEKSQHGELIEHLNQQITDVGNTFFQSRTQLVKYEEWQGIFHVAQQDLETNTLLHEIFEVEAFSSQDLDESYRLHLTQLSQNLLDSMVTLKGRIIEDQHAVAHLRDHRLLGPSDEVQQLLQELEDHQLHGWSGWHYIAENGTGEKAREWIERYPEVITGIIVSERQYAQAKDVLREVDFQLNVPIVVAPVHILEQAGEERDYFVIGPTNYVHFDYATAEQEIEEREHRLQVNQDALQEVEHRHEKITMVLRLVQTYMVTYPSHIVRGQEIQLQTLRKQCQQYQQQKTTLEADLQQRQRQMAAFEVRMKEITKKLGHIRSQIHTLELHEGTLSCDEEEQNRLSQQVLLEEQQHRERALLFSQEAETSEQQGKNMLQHLSRLSSDSGMIDQECQTIRYTDPSSVILPVFGDRSVLHQEYDRACEAYEQKIGKNELSLYLKNAEQKEREERLKKDHALHSSVQLSDVLRLVENPESEEWIRTRYKEAVEGRIQAEYQLQAIQQQLREAEKEKSKTEKTWLTIQRGCTVPKELFAEEEPCLLAASEAEERFHKYEQQQIQLQSTLQPLQLRLVTMQVNLQKMEHLRERVSALLTDHEILCREVADISYEEQIAENISEAQFELYSIQLREEWGKATQAVDLLNTQRSRIMAFIRSQLSGRLSLLTYVQRLQASTNDELENHSHDIQKDLTFRQQQIEEDLQRVQDHRQLIVSDLLLIADTGLRLLKSAVKLSHIPKTLSAFDGKAFLKLQYKEVSLGERRLRIETLLEKYMQAGVIPNGLALIQEVIRTLLHPFSVFFLFPHPGSPSYESASDVSKDSGGERLTCTILLYCTLVRLRAIERAGHTYASSFLLLDNPLGAASLPLFLELQRVVAKELRIQLLYTTGIKDPEALRVFPHVVRLCNKANEAQGVQGTIEYEDDDEPIQKLRILFPAAPIISERKKAPQDD